MKISSYSSTPLAKKLGIKDGFTLHIIGQPDYYFDLFTDLPESLDFDENTSKKKDFIHFFTKSAEELKAHILILKNNIKSNGMIWVSWPKKASKVPTDITEDYIRDLALKNGLVDIKVCAIDDIWSGLKLVIPVKNR